MNILILICRGVERLLEVETNADDQVAAIGNHGFGVGHEVCRGGGLCRVDLNTELGLCGLQAVVCGLVEGLVVPTACVRNSAGLEACALRCCGGARF